MKIVRRLYEELKNEEVEIKDVWLGLHWTAVESMYVGMAHTYKTDSKIQVENAGSFTGLDVRKVIKMALSKEPLNASVGIAAINSLIKPIGIEESVNPYIEKESKGKTICIIGRFPFNDEMRKIAKKTYILEFEPLPGELPSDACEEVVPKADINIITATTLINGTIDHLLEISSGKNIVLGPSTPMHPILFEYGIDVLAGVRVVDKMLLQRAIVQGVKKFKQLGGTKPITLYKSEYKKRKF